MPELPEVETIRNKFRLGTNEIPSLIGKRVTGIDLLWERTLESPTAEEFAIRIVGQSFTDVGRRGKYLLFHLEESTLVIHLRMSGDLWYEKIDDPIAPHHRLLIFIDNDHRLTFNDTRKFGRIWLVEDVEALLSHLGPEPLEKGFTSQDFHQRLGKYRRQLKPLLLDQSFLAGVGNIYADEALHLAKLHPLKRSHTLGVEEATILLDTIRTVLNEGIRRNGSSIDWVYRGGEFQNYFQVYQRTGESCYQCAIPIERITVGQRGTHFCPQCQPHPDG
ncbi:MAG: DNA-formamidopyrimidine glycosylase [Chloroflexi bacterium]|nr:DNA-formamidopyrimidine glycosylase [Chloroflexota bacterium]